jgi:hypothetical protein
VRHDLSNPEAWPFSDPPETEVITLERILDGRSPNMLVTHDEDDDESSWQFLDGEQVFEDDGVTVLLGEMVQFDPRIIELADLARGWHARRSDPGQPWGRSSGEPSL